MDVSGQLHATATLYRKLEGAQSRSGRYGEEKNLFSRLAMEPQFLGRRGTQ
jgi:hypothetical protein